MMKYCFGVDVGGTTVKLGLFTVEGELLDKWEIKTYTENEGERILPDVAEAIKGKIAEKLLKAEEICGIGVGVPAPVDKNGAIERAANVGWMAKEIKKELEMSDNLAKPDWHHHHDHFMDSNPNVRWKETLEHAEKIGLGNREYELIKF